MATTDLKLETPGTLQPPGPVGRGLRLMLGIACLYYVAGLVEVAGSLMTQDGRMRPVVWNGMLPGLLLVNYVVNIGYSRAWRKWPAIASGAAFLVLVAFGYLLAGSAETLLLARSTWLWELYVFSHLGVAFVIASLIGTPGCEMRAFHDLYARLSGVPAKEHECPIGPLAPVDRWEARKRQRDR